ncbi:MAG: acyl-CoA dehydrogenase family protein, partial [Bacteroidota bacterium]|nr:acyl-CoA dehydrogenase family protein [Bacteroidota bacterium]
MSVASAPPPDYYHIDDLLTDEHKIVRSAIRDWVDREVKPIIEEACQKHEFPRQWIR